MANALDRRNTAPDRGEDSLIPSSAASPAGIDPYGHYAEELAEFDLVKIMQQCETENQESLSTLRGVWARSYMAYHSRHWHSSKYETETYKYRSRLFRPKTRSAVQKNQATAAAALFSTNDAVSVRAEYEDDPQQSASAAVLAELLNYRLDRTSAKGGIPWFRVSMGAHEDAQITGICASKQYWDYRTFTKKHYNNQPKLQEDGTTPMMGMDGQPEMDEVVTEEVKVYADRPMIELLPAENVYVDLRAPWYDPIQEGSYAIVRYPMSIGALKQLMASTNPRSPIEWLPIEETELANASRDYDDYGVRQARDGKNVRDAQRERDAPATPFQTVWVHENFMRFNGVDYCWWSLGANRFLSVVICTGDAYPQFHGFRPITYGVAALEPHVVYPQSPVESWQPIQAETNDLINLNLDALRQSIEPLTKVKTGSLFDARQLRMRGAAGANVVVRNMEDIEFDRIPEPSGQVYMQQNHLNADFDDLAGIFSGSSVQTNRSMNETVGGMRLLAGSANALSEFNLRIWVETWVEPTIRQTLQNIQYYESDEKAISLAGQRAKLVEKYGVSEITDELLEAEVRVAVNVGIGAADPMQRMTKLQLALQTLASVAPFADRMVKINMEEIIREVMGVAGYKEGMKFFTFADPSEMPPDPEVIKTQMEQAAKALELEVQERIADKANTTKEQLVKMQGLIDTVHLLIQQQAASTEAGIAAASREKTAGMQALQKMFSDKQKSETSVNVAKLRPRPKASSGGKK